MGGGTESAISEIPEGGFYRVVKGGLARGEWMRKPTTTEKEAAKAAAREARKAEKKARSMSDA